MPWDGRIGYANAVDLQDDAPLINVKMNPSLSESEISLYFAGSNPTLAPKTSSFVR